MSVGRESTITRGFLFADLRVFRVDPEGADGAGDWVLRKQQDYGPPQ